MAQKPMDMGRGSAWRLNLSNEVGKVDWLMDLAPADDPTVSCELRLWNGESIVVFVHPREWKRVGLTGGTAVIVTSCGLSFPCRVSDWGEFYFIGRPVTVKPTDFGVPTHGDYPGTARIDWPNVFPDLLLQGLRHSPELQMSWKALSCEQMRTQLSWIFRARKTSTLAQRQLEVLSRLRT